MNIEERRQFIYAQLLRHSPEAGSLRDRVLDQLILAALLESSEISPIRVGAIQSNISAGTRIRALRTEVITGALNRLVREGRVGKRIHKSRNAYFLEEPGFAEIDQAAESAAELFEPVVAKILSNTVGIRERQDGAMLCRRFISECFSRFGQQIAEAVTGEVTGGQLVDRIDAASAFQTALSGLPITADIAESLRARCYLFLSSNDPIDQKLKFRLTQGYYVAQLLGFDSKQFNPVADEAFRGAILYIDTNVLLAPSRAVGTSSPIQEAVTLAKRIGIELRVTRATLDEMHKVVLGLIDDLNKVLETVPDALTDRTADETLQAFLDARDENPELTPLEFLKSVINVLPFLEQMGVVLDDRSADEIINDTNVSKECEVINAAALESRGWGKSEEVQRHDVAHYLAVLHERSGGKRAWFLTRDQSLPIAAAKLSTPEELPFTLRLVGFLQAISPFVQSSAEETSLAAWFSAALSGEVRGLPSDRGLFDLQELKLIGEFHSDVLSTPPEQLLLAFDFVKLNVLRGRQYQLNDHPKVALELKKYLSSTAEERQRALQEELHRQQRELETERESRKLSDKRLADLSAAIEEARGREVAGRKQTVVQRRKEGWLRLGLMLFGAVVALLMWRYNVQIGEHFSRELANLGFKLGDSAFGVRMVAALTFVGTAIPAILWQRRTIKVVALTMVTAVAIAKLQVFRKEWLADASDLLAIASPIALLLLVLAGSIREYDDNHSIE